MNTDRIWMWVAAALFCTTIASSYVALNYYSQTETYKKNYLSLLEDVEGLTILINIKIDYGNGTVDWYNDTRVPLDSTLLKTTQYVASVNYSTGEFGAFVNNINEVGGDHDTYWIWSYWDSEKGGWEMGSLASDQWILHKGDKVSWIYTTF